ncbi:NADH-quinone oxidoreductase subunit A [candidate division KSB1 bacterium]|nr:MAG: NADH-quinone oxidoreductase subunit A [candidate division KSB1 bacterium]
MEPSFFDNNLIRFLVLAVAASGMVGFFVALSAWLGPKHMTETKSLPFETGIRVKTDASRPFPIKYYLVAILFIVFDIEVAFLYPWAVGFRDLGIVGFVSMMVFLAILLVGLYYAVRKRVLDWK